jgi:hypothetical protein
VCFTSPCGNAATDNAITLTHGEGVCATCSCVTGNCRSLEWAVTASRADSRALSRGVSAGPGRLRSKGDARVFKSLPQPRAAKCDGWS